MVRNYKRQPGARAYADYGPNVIADAITAVQEGMSITKAAKLYKISKGTLMNRIHGKHTKGAGGETVLTKEEEDLLEERLLQCATYGFPLSDMDLRHVVKSYLDLEGRSVEKFSMNMPGEGWSSGFLKRHPTLTKRISQNIKIARGRVGKLQLKEYHNNLKKELDGLPPSHIFNYDETNLADNTSGSKYFYKRGTKYLDNLINLTKGCVTVMFCGAADGTLLPPFIVYKSDVLYSIWTEGGPRGSPCCAKACCRNGAHFHNTHSGWVDTTAFEKWFTELLIPHVEKLPGTKAVIGDNLTSHFSINVLRIAEENDIKFICLPPNSTHLTQPLDVAFFRPLKAAWKHIIHNFKLYHPKRSIVDKIYFARMVTELLNSQPFKDNIVSNLESGFRSTGIYPQNIEPLLKKLDIPDIDVETIQSLPSNPSSSTCQPSTSPADITQAFTKVLHEKRFPKADVPCNPRRKKFKVTPGMCVTTSTFDPQPSTSGIAKGKKQVNRRLLPPVQINTSTDSESDSEFQVMPQVKKPQSSKLIHHVHISPKKLPSQVPIDLISENLLQVPVRVSDLILVMVPILHGKQNKNKTYLAQVDSKMSDSEYSVTFFNSSQTRQTFTKDPDDKSLVAASEIIDNVTEYDHFINQRGQYVFSDPLKVSL